MHQTIPFLRLDCTECEGALAIGYFEVPSRFEILSIGDRLMANTHPRTLPRNRLGDSYQERAACPLYTAIGVINGRWKPMIYQRLRERPHGFGELRRAIPRVTTKVLREQLRQMSADDIIQIEHLSPPRLGVRYQVTSHGRTLEAVFETLWQWGRNHVARPGAARGTLVRAPHRSD